MRHGWSFAATFVACFLMGCDSGTPDAPADSSAVAADTISQAIADGPLGESARWGRAILTATDDSLPEYVRNDLTCTSCHLDAGTRPNAMPWTGVHARYPQYRGREARIITIEDRINGCFLRSMNGSEMPLDDPRMRAMVAYMAHLSKGYPVGGTVPGQGVPKPEVLVGDTVQGATIWQRECARCHGSNGEGTALAPPAWGERSYNIGAGMARIRTAAGFIKHNMPFDRPGSLSEEDAINVAAYLVSRPRPDFAAKHLDWPNGNPPADAAYSTVASPRP